MTTFFKTAIFALLLLGTPQTAAQAEEINYLTQMTALQGQAKEQADTHATELTRLQLMFNNEKKPKNNPILPKSKKYKKKHRTVDADLKELNQALRDDINKLLAPLPPAPTQRDHEKYRDLLISFGNNATRTLKALRDEMKWLKGQKKATFEVFQNYDAADKFLSRK